jgi:hypothetical protein
MAINLPIITEFDGKGLTRAIAEFKKLETTTEKAAFVMRKALIPATAALAGLTAAAIPAVKAASDLNETVSKTDVIFGKASKEVKDFGATTAKSLGISKTAALNASATFGVFGKAAGLTGTQLATFSTDFTALAADLASFNNTSPEQAITAIGAALRGESEPIRQYGVLLNDATLKQEALALGIYDGSGALTAQQKVLAAQAAIYKQTTDAQGDFARTSEGLANQQRILKASFDDLQAALGQALLPTVQAILPYLTQFANWASENPEIFIRIASIIGSISGAIVALNVGFKTYTLVANLATLASKSFAASQVLMLGKIGLMVAAITGLVLLLRRLQQNTDVVSRGMVVAFDVVGVTLINTAVLLARGIAQILNPVIDALNAINPFKNIPNIPEPSYTQMPSRTFGPSVVAPGFVGPTLDMIQPQMPTFTAPTISTGVVGGGGGGGGGGATLSAPTAPSFASPAIQSVLPDYFMADPTTQAAMNITINVDGGLATSADIGESVVNALRQYNQVQGPIPVAVA